MKFHLAITFAILLLFACKSGTDNVQPPKIYFAGMEPQVAEKLELLQSAVMQFPDSARAWGRLGMNLYIHDLREESIICFDRAATLDKTVFRWPYLAGYVRAQLHKPDAIEWIARSIQLNPRYEPAHVRHGNALLRLGKQREAEQAFSMALSVNPRSSHAYLGLARIAFAQKKYRQSVENLQQALQLAPSFGEAYGLLASAYRMMNRRDLARAAMQQAHALPAKTDLREPLITEMIREGVSSYWYRYRARELAARARYYAALEQYKQAIACNPTVASYREVGSIHLLLQNEGAAIQAFLQALDIDPKDRGTKRFLIDAYKRAGQTELADQIAAEVADQN